MLATLNIKGNSLILSEINNDFESTNRLSHLSKEFFVIRFELLGILGIRDDKKESEFDKNLNLIQEKYERILYNFVEFIEKALSLMIPTSFEYFF